MKVLRYVFVLGSVGSLLFFSNCGGGGGNPEPVADQQFTKLSKTWTIANTNGANDGSKDRTPEYSAGVTGDTGPMKLTITGTKGNPSTYTYSVSGRPIISPWPKSGKWEFGSDPKQFIIRDKGTNDELSVNYSVDGSNLSINFQFTATVSKPGYTNPRAEVVTGNWTFKFTGN